jgi:hypothetical protein
MTADRSADAAARDVVRGWFALWYPTESVDPQTDGFMEHLAAAGFEIRERRPEPVVEISVEDARYVLSWAHLCDFWLSHRWDEDDQNKAIHDRIRAALARATGDGD